MPYNGSGTFSIVNTFVPNTTILSAAVNQNFTDIATGLSDCLTRDGQAGMTADFKAISGSLGSPGITFNSDATSGLYLPSTGELGLVSKSQGLVVNSAIYQATSATVQNGGSGYAVGDTIQLAGGTNINKVLLSVATLSGSAVATVTVAYGGNYSVVPSNPASQDSTDGSGTGATFNLTFASQFSKSIVTDEAGNLPWQRLGASSFVSGIMSRVNAYGFGLALFSAGSGIAISHASPAVISATLNPTLVPNYISGLTLSTAGSSSTMTIAAGVANDSTNTTLMKLSSSISKTTASWAVGTGNGGIDTGSIANSTWYHFYEIERTDTGVVDVIFSLSASSPALPANYTLYRRIGAGKTDGSAHWTAFTQDGDTFYWITGVQDYIAVANTAGRVNLTLSVPTGVLVTALFRGSVTSPSVSLQTQFPALFETNVAVTNDNADLCAIAGASAGNFARLTDTSARIGVRSGVAGTGTYSILTYGWIDRRGKL